MLRGASTDGEIAKSFRMEFGASAAKLASMIREANPCLPVTVLPAGALVPCPFNDRVGRQANLGIPESSDASWTRPGSTRTILR